MKRYLLTFITIVAMSAIGPAEAKSYFRTGYILDFCESSESSGKQKDCYTYLGGVHDTYNVLVGWNQLAKKLYCAPDDVDLKQLRRIFIKYANEHPEDMHLFASSMAMNSFIDAFPCW